MIHLRIFKPTNMMINLNGLLAPNPGVNNHVGLNH